MRVRVCRDEPGPAINSFAFRLVAGGKQLTPDALNTDFDVVRDGCETGTIVFLSPGDAPASELRFRYADSGNPGRARGRPEYVEFSWTLR